MKPKGKQQPPEPRATRRQRKAAKRAEMRARYAAERLVHYLTRG